MITREQLVKEALSWIGTPYLLNQCCKGAGVDCARFVYAVYHECGFIPEEKIGIFGGDWSAHEKNEIYVFRLLRHAYKVAEGVSFPSLKAEPGNVVLVKTHDRHVYDHAGIIVKWPRVLHAAPECVREVDASKHWLWANRVVKVFDPWERQAAA